MCCVPQINSCEPSSLKVNRNDSLNGGRTVCSLTLVVRPDLCLYFIQRSMYAALESQLQTFENEIALDFINNIDTKLISLLSALS